MILDTIADSTRKRVAHCKEAVPLELIKTRALSLRDQEDALALPAFERALRHSAFSFICEVKRASPSKGIIAKDFPYLRIAKEYEEAGAAAISVLTEPEFFLGDDRYLSEIAFAVSVPVLRKDFIVDEYQIYEAKTLGAGAVLLIAALLKQSELASYIQIAASLGLSALVEVHTEAETERAVEAGAVIIGINNRDLRTFAVDLGVTRRLCARIPENLIRVSESGVQRPSDISAVADCGIDGLLIGEALMRVSDKKFFLDNLRRVINEYVQN